MPDLADPHPHLPLGDTGGEQRLGHVLAGQPDQARLFGAQGPAVALGSKGLFVAGRGSGRLGVRHVSILDVACAALRAGRPLGRQRRALADGLWRFFCRPLAEFSAKVTRAPSNAKGRDKPGLALRVGGRLPYWQFSIRLSALEMPESEKV